MRLPVATDHKWDQFKKWFADTNIGGLQSRPHQAPTILLHLLFQGKPPSNPREWITGWWEIWGARKVRWQQARPGAFGLRWGLEGQKMQMQKMVSDLWGTSVDRRVQGTEQQKTIMSIKRDKKKLLICGLEVISIRIQKHSMSQWEC